MKKYFKPKTKYVEIEEIDAMLQTSFTRDAAIDRNTEAGAKQNDFSYPETKSVWDD